MTVDSGVSFNFELMDHPYGQDEFLFGVVKV